MAVRFDAAESYNVTLSLGSQSAYSFTCWAYIATDRNNYSAVWSFDSNLDGTAFILQTDVDGTTMKVYDDNVGNFIVTGPNMTTGTWYFFAVTVSGTSGTLYYRTASASTLSTATWTGAARTITRVLVGDDRYTEWWNGRVAAFKFWQAGLTQAEVERESLQYVPHRTANIRLWLPFVRAETTDYSGNGHTLSGGATTTTEDGPPIPWVGRSVGIILPAAAAGGTNANAENVAFSVTGQDATGSILPAAEAVAFTAAAQDVLANVKPNADVVPYSVTANDATSLISPVVQSAPVTWSALDGQATVKPSAESVAFSVSALDATISTATVTNAPADVAPVGLAAQDPAAVVAPVADVAPVALAGMDASPQVSVAAEGVSAAVAAQDPQTTVKPSAEAAPITLLALDATVIIGTIVNADVATFGLIAADPTTVIKPSAEVVTFGMVANDATVLTGTTVAAGVAAFGMVANDATVITQSSVSVMAECAAIGLIAYPATVFQPSGSMSVADVPHQSMIRLTQPTAEAIGISRTGSSMSTVNTAGTTMGATDAI